MYLKTLVGIYAGQIRDFSPKAAKAMLADGRAERIPDNCPPEDGVVKPTPPAQPREAVAPVSDTGKTAGHDAPRQGGKRK